MKDQIGGSPDYSLVQALRRRDSTSSGAPISGLRDEYTRLEPVEPAEPSLRASIDASLGGRPGHPTTFGMLQGYAKGLEQHFVAKGFA